MRTVQVVLELDDRGSVKVRKFADQVGRATKDAERKGTGNLRRMSSNVISSVDRMSDRFLSFGKIAGVVFGGLAIRSVVQFGSSYESTMSGVRAVTQASATDFQSLSDQARELGATTQFTAVQSAQAMEELGKAGFTVTEILGVMPDVLNLAAAGTLDMASAASITSDVMRSMGIELADFTASTDIMAQTAINAKTTIQELGFAYQDAAPVARSLGVGFADLNVLLGTLANRGFTATRAGTALRRIFAVFLGDLEDGEGGLSNYNVAVQKNADGTTDLIGTFEDLVDAGLDANEVMEAFGLRGGPAALQIISALGLEVDGLSQKMEEFEGTAGRVAEERMDNLRGRGLELLSAMQELALTFFDQVGPGLADAAEAARDTFRAWGDLVKQSDVVMGLNRLFTIGQVLAVGYGLAIGANLATRALTGADALVRFAIGVDASNASMLVGISRLSSFGDLTAGGKAGFLALAAAVGAFSYQLTRAVLEVTGLDVKVQDFFESLLFGQEQLEAQSAGLEGTVGLLEAQLRRLSEFGIDVQADGQIEEVRRVNDVLGSQEGILEDLNRKYGAFAQTTIAGELKKAIAAANDGLSDTVQTADVLTATARNAIQQLERADAAGIAKFADEFKKSTLAGSDFSASVAQALSAMTVFSESAREESKAVAQEFKKQDKILAEAFDDAGIATTRVAEILAGEFDAALASAQRQGIQTGIVYETFGDRVNETIVSLLATAQDVPTRLYEIGTEALRIAGIRDQLASPAAGEPDAPESAGGPDLSSVFDEDFDLLSASLFEAIEPPELTQWQDFWGGVREASEDFVDTIGERWASFTGQAMAGFSNLVGSMAVGATSLSKGLSQLLKTLAQQAISTLAQWAIQRLITSKISGTATASEGAAQMSVSLASVFANTFSSIAAIPIIGPALAPGAASAALAAATAGSTAAGAAGAALGGGLATIAGGARQGGVITGRRLIEVGEFGDDEVIVPLAGAAASRASRALGYPEISGKLDALGLNGGNLGRPGGPGGAFDSGGALAAAIVEAARTAQPAASGDAAPNLSLSVSTGPVLTDSIPDQLVQLLWDRFSELIEAGRLLPLPEGGRS